MEYLIPAIFAKEIIKELCIMLLGREIGLWWANQDITDKDILLDRKVIRY